MTTLQTTAVNRELLRSAAEHLGGLAEEAKTQTELHQRATTWTNSRFARESFARYTAFNNAAQSIWKLLNDV